MFRHKGVAAKLGLTGLGSWLTTQHCKGDPPAFTQP